MKKIRPQEKWNMKLIPIIPLVIATWIVNLNFRWISFTNPLTFAWLSIQSCVWRCFIMITANSSQSNILNYHENVLNINFNLRPSSYSTNSNQQELDWWSTKRPFPGQDGGGRFSQTHRCCSFTSYSQFRLTHLQLLISECNKLISKKNSPCWQSWFICEGFSWIELRNC